MAERFEHIDRCYQYLQDNAGIVITLENIIENTGWSETNTITNINKRIKEFLLDYNESREELDENNYRVDRKILNASLDNFRALFRQKNIMFSSYKTESHQNVWIYDFYLPLTNEDILRQNLDELFFRDTLHRRLTAINIEDLESIYERLDEEHDREYFNRLTNISSDLFWGYSISTVNGRYRTQEIMTKEEAARITNRPYLIDETTAIVKFILPHKNISEDEVNKQNELFKILFIKAITESTPNEDEIWLLGNNSSVLYQYIKDS